MVKQESKQALHDSAASGFDGEVDGPVAVAEAPPVTEEEERATYERLKARFETEPAAEEVQEETHPRGHLHRFKTNRLGSACLVDGCEVKRQRKHAKRRSS